MRTHRVSAIDLHDEGLGEPLPVLSPQQGSDHTGRRHHGAQDHHRISPRAKRSSYASRFRK